MSNETPSADPDIGGRPSKYAEWMPAKVIELMTEGASKAELAAALGVGYSTLAEWQKDETKPEFVDAMAHGLILSEAWWQRTGREAVMGLIKGFQPKTWEANMKNRFGWRDRQELQHTGKDGEALPEQQALASLPPEVLLELLAVNERLTSSAADSADEAGDDPG